MKSVILSLTATALAFGAKIELGANPIRKVVNLLQAMQHKVESEGEKEKELYEKFACYCKTNTGELTKSIAEAQAKISQLETQVNEDTASKTQNDEELKNHKQDREDAENSLSSANKQRKKEADTYAKESGDTGINVAALDKAIKAIGEGLAGSSLLQQSSTAALLLKRLVMTSSKLSNIERESVASFLSGASNAPQSSEIVGILEEMKDEMSKDLNGLVEQEEQRKKQFGELASAKRKEISAATTAIELKTQRSGKLAVKIVQGKDDLEDTIGALDEDTQFQVNLRRDCATKESDMNERTKIRSQELQAISETIKVLNDDDALDLFKKTLPSKGSSSFLQAEITTRGKIEERARNIISEIAKTYKSTQLDFIALALHGKKTDFSKVIKMVENMVETLGTEQVDDDNHKEYCEKEFDTSDDSKGSISRRIESLTHDKDEAETASKNLSQEIKTLQEGISLLDKSVSEATENRKNEHAEYLETSSENSAALDLIAFAKNRLNKFYNPKQYKQPPARELSEEDRVYSNYGGELEPVVAGGIADTGISTFFIQLKLQSHGAGAPPPPPETFGAYSKKSSESGGVIALIDMLSNDLKADIQESEHQEKDSQGEYEELMRDSQKKRAADSKSVTTKEQAKAEADGASQVASENLDSSNQELYLIKEYISNLHKSCDFLLENYSFRKTARAQEVDSLKKAKAVLEGADYSLVQTRAHSFLATH